MTKNNNKKLVLVGNRVAKVEPQRTGHYKNDFYLKKQFSKKQNNDDRQEKGMEVKDLDSTQNNDEQQEKGIELPAPAYATLPLPVKKVQKPRVVTCHINDETAFRQGVKLPRQPSKVPGLICAILMLSLSATLAWKAHKINTVPFDNQNQR